MTRPTALPTSVAVAGLLTVAVGCSDVANPDIASPDVDLDFDHQPTPGATTAQASLASINGSGVTGRIAFVDNGSELRITGDARGLNPGHNHVSLIYDVDSPATGPEACEPAIFDPEDPGFILPTMFVSQWAVGMNGAGSLRMINIVEGPTGRRVRVPLEKIGTVSIRDATINGGFGPEAVVACGEVVTRP